MKFCSHFKNQKLIKCVFVISRMAPVPKYLKMHYVKEELSDGKCEWEDYETYGFRYDYHISLILIFFFSASPEEMSLQQALHESVFSPGISASPPHRVALCWDKHCQLLPEVLGLTAKRVATWSAEEVRLTWKADVLLTFEQHKHHSFLKSRFSLFNSLLCLCRSS